MFVELGTEIVRLASKFGELRTVIFGILMYFNLSKKYPFDLSKMIFGPNGLIKLLSGLKQVKKETQEILGLPAPQTKLGLPAPETGLVPTGPTSLTPTSPSPSSLVTTSQMSDEDNTNFFSNMINNARMASQNIWQLFMNMINKLRTAASNIFTSAFDTIKTKVGNFTNQIKKTYYKVTNQAFMTDESGKVHKAEVLDSRMSVYEGAEAKTASRVSQMWENHMGRLRDSIGRVKQDVSTVWEHHNERVAQSVKYASAQFNKLKTSASNTFGKISTVTSSVANGIKTAYGKAADFVKTQASSIRSAFVKATSKTTSPDVVSKTEPTSLAIGDGTQSAQQEYGKIGSTASKVAAEVSRIWKQHIVNLKGSFATVKNDITTIWQHHKIRVADSVTHAKSQFSGMTSGISAQFSKIKSGASNIFGSFAKFAQGASTKVKTIFGKMTTPIVDKFNKMSNGIKSAFNKIKTSASDTAKATASAFKSKLGYDDNNIGAPSWLSAGSSLTAGDLAIPENAAEEIDKINLAMQQGEVALNNQMSAYGGTNKALQAYIASLNGGKASMAGFKAFCDAQNISLKTTGTSALIAQVGVMALQTALSLGLSLVIQLLIQGLSKLGQWLKDLANPTEKLKEELSNLKSELSDIKSELDSVNTELETTQDRMAELLAMDSLSFTEQEELKNLQKQNDELERQVYLLEQRQKRKQKETEDSFDELIHGVKNNRTVSVMGAGSITESQDLSSRMSLYQQYVKEEESVRDELVKAEQSGDKKAIKKAENKLKKAEEKTKKKREYIDGKIEEYTDAADGIDYDLADDETKEYLDYIYNLEDKFNIIIGEDKAKEIGIKRIFNKEEFSDEAEQINEYIEALKAGDTSAKTSIGNIINSNEELKDALKEVGLDSKDAISYFTDLSSNEASDTIDGKIEDINIASKKFEELVNDTGKLKDIFKDDGKVDQTKLSEMFVGTSDEMRKDITSILEGAYDEIQDGTVKIDDLLTKFGLRTTEQFLRVQNGIISNQNKEWFPGLEDEISGIIDTFSELAAAVGSTVDAMDTLDQARKEEAHSGSVSIETLAKLMEYTDDYSKIVSIDETGAIHLAKDAQNILIQEKINAIKTNAQAAVQEAELTYQNALAAESSVGLADVIAGSTIPQFDELAGAIAYAGSILGDLEAAMSDGWGGTTFSLSSSMSKAESAYSSKISGRQSVRTQATSDAEEALRKAKDNLKIAEGLTVGNIESRYSSSVADGSSKTNAEEEALDKYQKEMDYWENRIAANQARYEQIQSEIDLLEKQGKRAGEGYYKEQIKLENERLKLLEAQKAEAQKFLGTFAEGSDEWWEIAGQLNDIEGEIDSVTASIQDLNDAMDQIHWDIFDETHERFGNLTNQLQTIRDLLSADEDSFFNDEGEWTETGVAVLGTYIQELEMYENALKMVQDEIKNLDIYDFDSEQEYYDKKQELIEQEQDYVKAVSDSQQSVVDMYESQIDAVEEYTSELVDAYNEYIDVVKESLDAERD